jgi:hypothetical protein
MPQIVVAHGITEGPVDDLASSVMMMVTSLSMVLGEEIIGSKVENAKEPNRSGVGNGGQWFSFEFICLDVPVSMG